MNKLPPTLHTKIEGNRMGQTAAFDCALGYRLEGSSSMTCQYNGKIHKLTDFTFFDMKYISNCFWSSVMHLSDI